MQLLELLKTVWIAGKFNVGTEVFTAEPDAEVKTYFQDGRRSEDGSVTTRWLYALTNSHLVVVVSKSDHREGTTNYQADMTIRRLPLKELVMVERTYLATAEFDARSVTASTFTVQARCIFTASSGIEPLVIQEPEPAPEKVRKYGDKQLEAYTKFCLELIRMS